MELGVGADVVAKGMMATFCWEGGREGILPYKCVPSAFVQRERPQIKGGCLHHGL